MLKNILWNERRTYNNVSNETIATLKHIQQCQQLDNCDIEEHTTRETVRQDIGDQTFESIKCKNIFWSERWSEPFASVLNQHL